MAQTVIGIFDNSNQAQTAVQQLTGSGYFPRSNRYGDRSSLVIVLLRIATITTTMMIASAAFSVRCLAATR